MRAVATAAELVLRVAKERGYPVADRERMLADLSVSHARRLAGYQRAEQTAAAAESASTEDLRQALLGYRALFRDLADPGRQARPPTPLRLLATRFQRPAIHRPTLRTPAVRPPALGSGGQR